MEKEIKIKKMEMEMERKDLEIQQLMCQRDLIKSQVDALINITHMSAFHAGLEEHIAKLEYQREILVKKVLELEPDDKKLSEFPDSLSDSLDSLFKAKMLEITQLWDLSMRQVTEQHKSPTLPKSLFKEKMQRIILLWDLCHTSLIHRTRFFLLFEGDPEDEIYIEVELRRLTWLQQHITEVGNSGPAQGEDSTVSLPSSVKLEREFLSERMNSRLTEEERKRLYKIWQIPLEGKQMTMCLVNKLWTDLEDSSHIKESAAIVARLVDFELGNVAKEMFELNFTEHCQF